MLGLNVYDVYSDTNDRGLFDQKMLGLAQTGEFVSVMF